MVGGRETDEALPASVARLMWDVDADTINLDLDRDANLVIERVMSRGDWAAMGWLRRRYCAERLAAFLRTFGAQKLAPRDLAYWTLVCDVNLPSVPGGGRPRWAGP